MPKIDTTVGNLVDMIRNGELRLPEMQRRYIWPATRVRDLLDSLYRGYPSGTIWSGKLTKRGQFETSPSPKQTVLSRATRCYRTDNSDSLVCPP